MKISEISGKQIPSEKKSVKIREIKGFEIRIPLLLRPLFEF